MKYVLLLLLMTSTLVVFLAHNNRSPKPSAGRCTGSDNCTACSNCSSCQYCNSGGTCGVCNRLRNIPANQHSTGNRQPFNSYQKPATTSQCQAITKKGRQCSRRSRSNGFCWQHGG